MGAGEPYQEVYRSMDHNDGVCMPREDAASVGVRLVEEVYEFAKSRLPGTQPGGGQDKGGQSQSTDARPGNASPAETIANKPTDQPLHYCHWISTQANQKLAGDF